MLGEVITRWLLISWLKVRVLHGSPESAARNVLAGVLRRRSIARLHPVAGSRTIETTRKPLPADKCLPPPGKTALCCRLRLRVVQFSVQENRHRNNDDAMPMIWIAC